MKQTPVLENVYARIDVLDLDKNNKSFNKISSIFMLGEVSQFVKSIDDLTVKNKQLVSAIGVNTIKYLLDETPTAIKGGDDWEELDDLDFEELLNTENIPIIDKTETAESKSIITGNHFSNLILYTSDKLTDVQEKIAIATKIKPYKQYLWMPSEHKSLSGDEISLMSYWMTSIRTIEDYPVDAKQLSNLNNFQSSIQSFVNHSALIISCISLDSIIHNRSKLQFLARSDSESYELIHSNFIQRFYPTITLPIFNQYLLDETLLESKFEILNFDENEITNRYSNRSKLLSELDKQKKVTIDSSDLLTVTTTGMNLIYSYGDLQPRIDVMKLFQSIDITNFKNIAYVDLYCYDDERRPIRLRKFHQQDQFRINKNGTSAFINTNIKKQLLQKKSIIISLLPNEEYEIITIIIDQYGTSWIQTQPNHILNFSKAVFLEIIIPIIDPILHYLNSIEASFINSQKIMLLNDTSGFQYQIPASSSKITFKFPVSYTKLLDLIINKLLSSGFIEQTSIEQSKRNNPITSFIISYGVSIDNLTGQRSASVDIRNINNAAVITLLNLDVEETALYIDIIGRLIDMTGNKLTLSTTDQTQLTVVDPVLFRLKVSSDGYSRICQKKFQPVLTDAKDPNGVKYYNFTFQRPEYYKCPTKSNPVLGFIQGKHPQGYCLPCCRKTPQSKSDILKTSCVENEGLETTVTSTYKIDYPIPDISNSKIINRRISLPIYILQLFGIQNIVANGTILASHGEIRDGIDADTKSFLQTATIISAISDNDGNPLYDSPREFVLALISMIKQPLMQINIMRNKLISDRFTTPQALIHALEDKFIREKILTKDLILSAVEWNDLIVYLANCMGINILLLQDERNTKGIQLININDINESKPMIILLKRLNIEWSSQNPNTRALYLPITPNSFKVSRKSKLIIPVFDISKSIKKIKKITNGSMIKIISKQFTLDKLSEFVSQNKTYQLLDDLISQKIAIIKVGRNKLITTISTLNGTIHPKNIDIEPTATIKDLLLFITDYNLSAMDSTDNIKDLLNSYKLYINIALKTTTNYELIQASAFFLKISKFIIYKSNVIGAIVNVVDVKTIIATELMFIKPISVKSISNELSKLQEELNNIHKKLNSKAIIAFPMAVEIFQKNSFIEWFNNPLKVSDQAIKCKVENMHKEYNIGLYTSEIYNLLIRDLIKHWGNERCNELDMFIITEIKKIKSIPVVQTTIDKLIDNIDKAFDKYDPTIIRVVINATFDHINSIDKTITEAINRIKTEPSLVGFELKNIHRFTKAELTYKVKELMKDLTTKVSSYPTFELNRSITDQRYKFYDTKSEKLLIHTHLYSDLIEILVSDLLNPFRRDYLLNFTLLESSFTDIKPHLGELIYVQRLDN